MSRYDWIGWDYGEDVTPPEPGKKWLTITDYDEEIADYDEEIAIIVHRPVEDAAQNERLMKLKEKRAQMIVDALNKWAV